MGIVFRAQSFDDYFMLEVWRKNSYLCIRPHVRVLGDWDAPFLNPDANSRMFKGGTLNIVLRVESDSVKIIVNGEEEKSLEWILPMNYKINLRENKGIESDKLANGTVNKIPFRDMAGMFGFRNYGNEIAVVKSLSIKPL